LESRRRRRFACPHEKGKSKRIGGKYRQNAEKRENKREEGFPHLRGGKTGKKKKEKGFSALEDVKGGLRLREFLRRGEKEKN